MARRVITALLRTLAKVFFRRIEIVGDVPRDGPVIFAVNHPNALVDPLFLLCFAPRRVSFLAKAPLFSMPVIGWIARAFDSIPVYRRQDNMQTASNRETFARAREILAAGGAIAIFPEGTTHSDPKLRELKTGVSRIALGASLRVLIVPTGLYYTSKQTFRSSALVYFSAPIAAEPQSVDQNGEPDAAAVDVLTGRIEEALASVTLQADSHEALELIGRAERIFSADRPITLAEELELRKRFVAGYTYLSARDPARLARLESQIAKVDVPPEMGAVRLFHLLLLPLGFIGAVIHWPAYKLIGVIAHRADRETEATVKILAGLLIYPLLWILIALFIAPVAILLLPLLGYCAIVGGETLEGLAARPPDAGTIREEILGIAAEITAESDRDSGSAATVTGPSPQESAQRR